MEHGLELLFIGAAAVLFALFFSGYRVADAKLLEEQMQLEQRLEEDRIMLLAEGVKLGKCI